MIPIVILLICVIVVVYIHMKIRETYDDRYSSNYDLETPIYIKAGLNLIQSYLFSDDEFEHVKTMYSMIGPKDNSTILDMGCGTGEVSRLFKVINPTLNMIAITNSPIQKDIASKKGVNTILTDYHNVPLPDGTADMAMFFESMGYGNNDKLLAECNRLLKPGGIVIIKDFFGCKPGYDTYYDLWKYTFYAPDTLERVAHKNNFKIIVKNELPMERKNFKKFKAFYESSKELQEFHGLDYFNICNRPIFYILQKT